MADKLNLDQAIRKYYDVRKKIGTGAYGSVWDCIERSSGRRVAVKKIEEAFRNSTDAQRTYREVSILRQLRRHPNVICLYEVRRAQNNMDIYLIFEHMDIDLHQLITKKGNCLLNQHYQLIIYQILLAIKYMHSAGIVHRDLKPSNILVNSRCQVKVCDLGLARTLGPRCTVWTPTSGDHVMTGYIATRWYRPPEILLGCKRYTRAVDMWSIGCILAEMVLKKPLFQGDNSAHQIDLILSSLPQPSARDVESLQELGAEADRIGKRKGGQGVAVIMMAGGATSGAGRLAEWFLSLAPSRRPSAARALGHPFLVMISTSTRLPPPPPPLNLGLSDDVKLHVDDYRSALYRDAGAKKSPRIPQSPRRRSDEKMRPTCVVGSLPNVAGRRLTQPNASGGGGDAQHSKQKQSASLPVTRPLPQARTRRYGRWVMTTIPQTVTSVSNSKSETRVAATQHRSSLVPPSSQSFPSIHQSHSQTESKCPVIKVYRRGYKSNEATTDKWNATVRHKRDVGVEAT